MIWIGTEGGGLNRFDPETGMFVRYAHDPENAGSIAHNIVRSLYEDHDGFLWIGTEKGLNRFDRKTGKFVPYCDDSEFSGFIMVRNCYFHL